jgi:hypothetical protein
MPQGSVIGNHQEIELVTPDVRASSLFSWWSISSCQTPMCCLAAGKLNQMTKNKVNLVQAAPVPTDGEIELAVGRLSPNWTRVAPRPRNSGTSCILQSLAHGRSHAVVREIKRSPRRLGSSINSGGGLS